MTTNAAPVEESLSGEEMIQRALADLNAQEAAEPEVTDEAPEVEAAEPEQPDDVPDEAAIVAAETKARADGWVSYEEWKDSGRDPRLWRPADEFNDRGLKLKAPKGDLVKEIDELKQAQREAASLLAKQIRLAEERRQADVAAAVREALANAEERRKHAWTLGDQKEFDAATADANEAAARLRDAEAPAPVHHPAEVVQWTEANKWYSEGFDELGAPKTPAVATFLDFQKRYVQARPSEPVINSIRYAEGKVKEFHPQTFAAPKPPAPARPAAAQVHAGSGGGGAPIADHDAKFNRLGKDEQSLVKQMMKATGLTLKEYMKEYK